MTLWIGVLVGCLGCYLLKLAGVSVPESVLQRPRVHRIAALLPVVLLAALVAVQTFSTGSSLVLDARAAGLAVAGIAVWRRWPFLVVVGLAALTTARSGWPSRHLTARHSGLAERSQHGCTQRGRRACEAFAQGVGRVERLGWERRLDVLNARRPTGRHSAGRSGARVDRIPHRDGSAGTQQPVQHPGAEGQRVHRHPLVDAVEQRA